MVEYDVAVIQKFAAKLYAEASRIVAGLFVLFGILGAFGLAILFGGRVQEPILYWFGVLFSACIGGAIGQARSFHLRLQAQMALCQAQIERNTRGCAQRP